MSKEHIKEIIANLPSGPGIYQYLNKEGEIIYIGKAKNLKKRVSSYFNKIHDTPKTSILVRKIADIKYIVVATEEDALHLENSLIKEHQPRYNVMLKDDKTYPSLALTHELFPRILYTRNRQLTHVSYYGPYSNVSVAKGILELIHELYPIRNCKLSFTPERIKQNKYKICLQYHIKRCKGPCEGLQTAQEYDIYVQDVRKILSGNSHEVKNRLKELMETLSQQLKFEEAAEVKKQFEIISAYQSKTIVVNPSLNNLDVCSYEETEKSAYINMLHITNGSITKAMTIEYRKALDETREELLGIGIIELRKQFNSLTREVIVPFQPDIQLEGVLFTIPQRGDKRRLLELSEQNVKQYKLDKLKQEEKLNPEQRATRVLSTLQKDLQLNELPIHIECFDNSNIQGTNPVAACVVFKMAKAAKKEYRHFNVKTVIGPDDFASMTEIVTRRYKRMVEEETSLPQLIIIDGGKGQLHAAVDALKSLDLFHTIPIIGIAKRLEEIYFPNDPIPLYLDKNSESLRLIQQMRDEAHRFGITFHRLKRSKKQVTSELDSITGIGAKTKELLLSEFKSVKRIKEASLNELIERIGKSKGEKVFNLLHNQQTESAKA